MLENLAVNINPVDYSNEQPVVNTAYKPAVDDSNMRLIRDNLLKPTDSNPDKRLLHMQTGILGGLTNTVASIVKAARDKARKESLPLCAHRIALGKYGPGYPLYFEYIIVCGVILSLMFGIVSIHSMYYNHKGDTCDEFKNDVDYPCKGGTAIDYSIGNRGPKDSFRISSVLNLTFTLISLVLAFFYRKVLDKTADQVDDSTVTAADYTVMVQNLPQDETAEDIKEFFEENGRKGKSVEVLKVCMAYQIGHYINLIRKEEVIKKKKAVKPLSAKYEKKLQKIQENIQAMRNNTGSDKIGFTGIAFVTFKTQKETTDVINKFSMGAVQSLLFSAFSSLGGVCCKENDKLYKSRVIKVTRSFEPSDIFWENLGLPTKVVLKKKLINLIASSFIIVCCFGLILGTKYVQTFVADHTKHKAVVTFLSLLCSVFVVVINASLGSFVRRLAQYEKPETNTSYQVNVAEGLSMAQFINTAFVTLIVKLVQERTIRLWTADGIVPDFFFVFLLNAFVPSVTKVIDVGYFLKSYQRKRALEQSNSKITAQKAEKLFQDPPFDVAQRYAAIQKTMLFTAFYACMLPLGVLFSIIGLVMTYWADKYQFLRRTNMPPVMGKVLAEEMADYLELIIVSFCAGNLVFEKIAADSWSVLNVVALAIAGLFLILPNGTVADCIFPEKENNEDTTNTYEDAARIEKFYGYDELNPANHAFVDEEIIVADGTEKETPVDKDPNEPVRNNGVDLDALELYARERQTFLQAQSTKQKAKSVVFAPKSPPKQTTQNTTPGAAANPFAFHMAMSTAHENKTTIKGMFKSIFSKKKRPMQQKAKDLSSPQQPEVVPLTVQSGANSPHLRAPTSQQQINVAQERSPGGSISPTQAEKTKVLETQQMRIRSSMGFKKPTATREYGIPEVETFE